MSRLKLYGPTVTCLSVFILDLTLYIKFGGDVLLASTIWIFVCLVVCIYFMISTISIHKDIERIEARMRNSGRFN